MIKTEIVTINGREYTAIAETRSEERQKEMEDIEFILNAIQKATPMKPIEESNNDNVGCKYYCCPRCKHRVSHDEPEYGTIVFNYCRFCGQAIDLLSVYGEKRPKYVVSEPPQIIITDKGK